MTRVQQSMPVVGTKVLHRLNPKDQHFWSWEKKRIRYRNIRTCMRRGVARVVFRPQWSLKKWYSFVTAPDFQFFHGWTESTTNVSSKTILRHGRKISKQTPAGITWNGLPQGSFQYPSPGTCEYATHDCLTAWEPRESPWEFHWSSIHTIDVPECKGMSTKLIRNELQTTRSYICIIIYYRSGWITNYKPSKL
jgi:hypothetical protein